MIVTDEGFFTKAKALDELARRQASDVQQSEDYYHPWSLPKGNFKHRMLSTGWHHLFGIVCIILKNGLPVGMGVIPFEKKLCLIGVSRITFL